jgi:hypothetical protein
VGAVGDGGVYDPVANSWTAIASGAGNEPSARYFQTGVWAGGKVVIWGGFDGATVKNDGGVYDVAAGTWAAITSTNVPAARSRHIAVSTGDKMIVWGGWNEVTTDFDDGGIYDVGANTWTSIASGMANEPVGRYYPSAVWTGAKLIIWGGHNFNCSAGCVDTVYQDGGMYDVAGNSWTAIASGQSNEPSAREFTPAHWTGKYMILWGGTNQGALKGDGGLFDPAAGTWTSIASGMSNEPSARQSLGSVWTGKELLVWGGTDGIAEANGGLYNPTTNAWAFLPSSVTNTPTARYDHTPTWTGSQFIVWGGYGNSGPLGTGGIYLPYFPPW